MSTIQDLFQQAQLAEAAYANFFTFIGGSGTNWIVGNGAPSSTDPVFFTGDMILAGTGDNQIFAGAQMDIAGALAQQDTLVATGQLGDLIAVLFGWCKREAAND